MNVWSGPASMTVNVEEALDVFLVTISTMNSLPL
jgi:hypothetical protein